MSGFIISTHEQVGDFVSLEIASNTLVGIVTSNVGNGVNLLDVNSTVIENMPPNYKVSLLDSNSHWIPIGFPLDSNTFTINDLGICTNVNTSNSQISTSVATQNAFTDIGNVYVRMTIDAIRNLKIGASGIRYSFAEKKLGGKYIPPNTSIDVVYKNMDGNSKVFDFNLEYLY
jgi:hypothetical protein